MCIFIKQLIMYDAFYSKQHTRELRPSDQCYKQHKYDIAGHCGNGKHTVKH